MSATLAIHADGGSVSATWFAMSLSFSDDSALQRPAIDDLHARCTNAPVQRAHLTPADVGLARVGHFGFFKRGSERLWGGAVAWVSQGHNGFAGGA